MLRKWCKHISETFFVGMQALPIIPLFNTVSKEQLTHERIDIKRALLKTVLLFHVFEFYYQRHSRNTLTKCVLMFAFMCGCFH